MVWLGQTWECVAVRLVFPWRDGVSSYRCCKADTVSIFYFLAKRKARSSLTAYADMPWFLLARSAIHVDHAAGFPGAGRQQTIS